MAATHPVDLGFAALKLAPAEVAGRLLAFLADRHRLDPRSVRRITRITLDDTWQWADSSAVRVAASLQGALQAAGSSFSIAINIVIGQDAYPIKIYIVPALAAGMADGESVCVNLKLGSAPYEAVFGFRARDEGMFDDQAKRGLLQLCLGSATCLASPTFMLAADDADFVAWPVDEVVQRLLKPELTLRGRRPGMLTGIDRTLIDMPSLLAIWGPERMAEGDGFAILDDLVPDDTDDED